MGVSFIKCTGSLVLLGMACNGVRATAAPVHQLIVSKMLKLSKHSFEPLLCIKLRLVSLIKVQAQQNKFTGV